MNSFYKEIQIKKKTHTHKISFLGEWGRGWEREGWGARVSEFFTKNPNLNFFFQGVGGVVGGGWS